MVSERSNPWSDKLFVTDEKKQSVDERRVKRVFKGCRSGRGPHS